MKTAFRAIKSYFEGKFPNLKILLNFPDFNLRIKYPFLSIIQVNHELIGFNPSTVTIDPLVYKIGEIRGRIDLQVFETDLPKLTDWVDDFLSKIRADNPWSRSISIKYGKPYEGIQLRIMRVIYDQQPFKIQAGKGRRAIIECEFSMGDFVSGTDPIMKRFVVDGSVSEKESPS